MDGASQREGPAPPAGRWAVVIVPARLASTRFPEKMLAARTGKPLVQHAVEAARAAACAREVVVAADHRRIAEALAPYGTRVVLTSPEHPNGTSRLAEAAALLGLPDEQVVVNAQGDEPEMAGAVVDAAAGALVHTPRAAIGTACAPLGWDEAADPNVVKVARALDGTALYFSRSVLPCDRDGRREPAARPLRHIGVYAYRAGFLRTYAALASTPLERAEQLEQLRALEHGHAIAVATCAAAHPGIDTPEQYEAFVRRHAAKLA